MNNSVVSAVFDSYDEAERALSELRRAGVRESALSVIAQHDGKTTETSDGHITEHDKHGSIIAGRAATVAAGVTQAAEAIDSRRAAAVLDRLVQVSHTDAGVNA